MANNAQTTLGKIVPSSEIPTGASPSPSSSPGVVNTQGLTTGTAHDMSNKGAPGRPGLAPSPQKQGNVVQQQQPPQGMIIQPQQYMIQQQGGREFETALIQQSQTPPQNYQANEKRAAIQENLAATVARLAHDAPTPAGPDAQIATHFSSRPTQQVNLPPGGATISQSNQQGTVPSQMRPQAYQATLPQAPQHNAPPKKKSLIRIVDPKSNQDITDTVIREASMTTGSPSPHFGQSSASGTPPASQTPPQNHQANEKRAAIHARFAAQVARLAYDVPVTRVPRNAETQD